MLVDSIPCHRGFPKEGISFCRQDYCVTLVTLRYANSVVQRVWCTEFHDLVQFGNAMVLKQTLYSKYFNLVKDRLTVFFSIKFCT